MRIVIGDGVVEQHRQQILIARGLRADHNAQRIGLRCACQFERLKQIGMRASDLPKFVMNDERGVDFQVPGQILSR